MMSSCPTFENVARPPRKEKDETSAYYTCAFCAGEEKMEVNHKRKLYYCHKCQRGGCLKDTPCMLLGDQLAEPKFAGAMSAGPQLWDLDLYQPLELEKDDFRWGYLSDKRGLSEITIQRLNPHTGPEFDRVYFPVYHDLDLTTQSFIGRAVFDEHLPKYKHPNQETLQRLGGKSFWGLPYCTSESDLVLVEGVFDACHALNRLALMGSSLTPSQIHILEQLQPKSITVMLDGDALKQTAKVLSQLIERGFKNLYLVRLPWDQDPDSLKDTQDWESRRESVA